MGDNNPPIPPSPQKGNPMPPLPSSAESGPALPTTQLPPIRTPGNTGKVVVMLSSVAKTPSISQSLPAPPVPGATATPPPVPAKAVLRPPPLPANEDKTPSTDNPRLSTTTYVKVPSPVPKVIPPIKLNEPTAAVEDDDGPGESIFPDAPAPAPAAKPAGWKSLEPGELPHPTADKNTADPFARTQSITPKPVPGPVVQSVSTPSAVPPISARVQPVATTSPLAPPRTIPSLSNPPPAPPVHHAPPMMEQGAEEHAEKLPQPHLPIEPEVVKVPPLASAPTSPVADKKGQPTLPPKSSTGLTGSLKNTATTWLKKVTPAASSPAAPVLPPKVADAKPALKPPVVSKRTQAQTSGESKVEDPAPPPLPVVAPKESTPPVSSVAATKLPDAASPLPAPPLPQLAPSKPATPPENKATTPPPVASALLPAAAPLPKAEAAKPLVVTGAQKAPLSATRAERSKKRRLVGTVVFYVILILGIGPALYFGSLYFGRDTRIEGQIIPPEGMTLNNEVWIVTDFRELASGIAEDLAADRTPLMQEIQERQEHVQRAQADVAAREEKIRLIQQEIQTAKDDMGNIGKQTRDTTQQLWAGDGAAIDSDYASRSEDLGKAISSRAKSLNLKYQPDPTYNSPEVWANAYRLALYDVPANIDQVKEHQWLSDQMKQWRDFVKSLDDRRAKLIQQAADIKTANGPKLADLQAKVDDATQRSDATAAEEVPLKAELQEAQASLIEAQASDAGLDDKYYKLLYALPAEAAPSNRRFPLQPNGRFTWVDDDAFAESVKTHSYWIFACATRPDGRQYWAMGQFSVEKNHKICLLIDPESFVSTKAILRPNLPPEEADQ